MVKKVSRKLELSVSINSSADHEPDFRGFDTILGSKKNQIRDSFDVNAGHDGWCLEGVRNRW